MSRATHIFRRGGIYWFRYRVPKGLQAIFGRSEVRRSLGTSCYRTATLRAASGFAWILGLCEKVRVMQNAEPHQIDVHVAQYFAALVAQSKLSKLSNAYADEAIRENELCLMDDAAAHLRALLEEGKADPSVGADLATFFKHKGIDLGSLPAAMRDTAVKGAMAAHIDHIGYVLHAVDAPSKPYQPEHELFADLLAPTPPIASISASGLPPITVATAIKKYRAEYDGEWAAKSKKDAYRVFAWLEEHLGAATDMHTVTKAQAASFRDALLSMESRSKAASFADRMTDNPERRISKRTANKYLCFVQSFFNWASGEAGLIESSPFDKISIPFPKGKSKAAQTATPAALEAFLLSPLFQGHQTGKLHKPGAIVARGEEYWFALLEIFLGARTGEIAQLLLSDVNDGSSGKLLASVSFRKIDDFGQNVAGKSLKTMSAERTVPLPAVLIELGFLGFVHGQAQKKSQHLFPAFAPKAGRDASAAATKFMSRYLERIEQKFPGKANHWLRHAVTDALRNSKTPNYLISQITGHAQSDMNSLYGTGADLETVKAALDSADYKFDLLATLLQSKERWTK